MKIKVCLASHKGRIRENNEDNANLNGWTPAEAELEKGYALRRVYRDKVCLCICDGMGGESNGEMASKAAVDIFSKYVNSLSEECIQAYTEEANDEVCRLMAETNSRMGSTFSAVHIKEGELFAANVGDSRIFEIGADGITQLSKDHTQLQSMIDNGVFTEEEAKTAKIRNYLTQYLGIFRHEMIMEPFYLRKRIDTGKTYLICSDGLTDMIEPEMIKETVIKSDTEVTAVRALLELALINGGKDNVTVAVIRCEESKE